jgi:hypothetical protein
VDEASFLDERAALQSQLEALRIRKEFLQVESERRVLRAGLSGTVTVATPFTEGMQSIANRHIITIADQSHSVFMVRGPDIHYLEQGELYDMSVNWEPYTAQMIDPDEFNISRASDEERYLLLVGDEPEAVSARTFATVHLTLDEVKDVLFVPTRAVKHANARTFVYVLADGVRTIRDVELGLHGNNTIEIISGLEEGEEIFQE